VAAREEFVICGAHGPRNRIVQIQGLALKMREELSTFFRSRIEIAYCLVLAIIAGGPCRGIFMFLRRVILRAYSFCSKLHLRCRLWQVCFRAWYFGGTPLPVASCSIQNKIAPELLERFSLGARCTGCSRVRIQNSVRDQCRLSALLLSSTGIWGFGIWAHSHPSLGP